MTRGQRIERGRFRRLLGYLRLYPTIGISLALILGLVAISLYALVRMPLSDALDLWNTTKGETWVELPKLAQPAWSNLFRREKLPTTHIIHSEDTEVAREELSATMWRETMVLTFDHSTARYPSEISLFYDPAVGEKRPYLTFTWIRPDGREIELFSGNPRPDLTRFWISQDFTLDDLFGDADEGSPALSGGLGAIKGEYALRVESLIFEQGYALDAQLMVYGGVYGIAGTDQHRRNMLIGLVWGAPISLMFGILATLGTTILGFMIAAIGAWFGGWVDGVIQRLTEISMLIPLIPTLLMVGFWYSDSLWIMLAFIVGLNILTGTIKTYRAMFIQVRSASYIEAAKAYGASNLRIIFRYLIPHVAPVLLPQFILGIPRFVFLEASIALLGVADPLFPTWGKILSEGRTSLYLGAYHCALLPALMLVITGLAFSMLGYALDRVFNPRLRTT